MLVNIDMGDLEQGDFNFPQGNITINVKLNDETMYGHVSSAAMALASPVWKKFVFPPWQAKGASSQLELVNDCMISESANLSSTMKELHNDSENMAKSTSIDFSEDNAQALQLLLRIVHLQFDRLPISIDCKLLFHLAELCDQYLCLNIVQPWLQRWIDESHIVPNEFNNVIAPTQCLFTYWTFGLDDDFRSLASRMVTATRFENGEYRTDDNHVLGEPSPPGIIDSILQQRARLLSQLLEIPYKLLDELKAKPVVEHCVYRQCRALTYGTLLMELEELKLWPKQTPDTITLTVSELATKLSGLSVETLHSLLRHTCMTLTNMKACVDKVMDSDYQPVLASHEEHLRNAGSWRRRK